MGGGSLAARTAGAIPQPNGMGGGGAAASYPAAVKTDGSRPPIQQDILAVFNSSNAQASDVGTSTDQVGQPGPARCSRPPPAASLMRVWLHACKVCWTYQSDFDVCPSSPSLIRQGKDVTFLKEYT